MTTIPAGSVSRLRKFLLRALKTEESKSRKSSTMSTKLDMRCK